MTQLWSLVLYFQQLSKHRKFCRPYIWNLIPKRFPTSLWNLEMSPILHCRPIQIWTIICGSKAFSIIKCEAPTIFHYTSYWPTAHSYIITCSINSVWDISTQQVFCSFLSGLIRVHSATVNPWLQPGSSQTWELIRLWADTCHPSLTVL